MKVSYGGNSGRSGVGSATKSHEEPEIRGGAFSTLVAPPPDHRQCGNDRRPAVVCAKGTQWGPRTRHAACNVVDGNKQEAIAMGEVTPRRWNLREVKKEMRPDPYAN
jgi:hypothetical protein